jgi:hypothetical protein
VVAARRAPGGGGGGDAGSASLAPRRKPGGRADLPAALVDEGATIATRPWTPGAVDAKNLPAVVTADFFLRAALDRKRRNIQQQVSRPRTPLAGIGEGLGGLGPAGLTVRRNLPAGGGGGARVSIFSSCLIGMMAEGIR